ncbi:MAG: hypothetical protein Q8Q08_01380 [Candidatus Omnitrophota bacterium]|nr:hypothetical protein [Candidatus Omnitrophota bacterium]MDZ4243396.1 hypothetical protein [Candidatus Omnitrophota bacterium]
MTSIRRNEFYQRFFVRGLAGVLLTVGIVTSAWATPPQKMDAVYDPKTKVLTITIDHVSRNLREHRIRKVVVYRNDKEAGEYHYATQTSPSQLIQEIPIDILPEDTIRVEAICSDAGRKEESFVISW